MNYLPRGIFDPNIFSEQELLELRKRAFELIRDMKTIMVYTGEGTSAGREFTMPPAEVLIEVTWSLKSKYPLKYGFISNRARNWFI